MASTELKSATTQNTDLLDQMNSTYEAHDYISDSVLTEQSRLLQLDALAKRDVYRLQGQSLSVVYAEDKSTFLTMLTRVVLFALMLVVAVLSVVAQKLISQRTGVYFAVTIMTITGVIVILLVGVAATRRNSVWSRFYWKNSGISGSAT